MDFAERYRALSSRDPRFDGRFVAAVRTTGIYCRPSCPARTPKPANVEFFPTSAAAHLAGYRACRRCLPEAAPGSPEWNLREDVAARAMRLIEDGAVERVGVAGLARALGYSERQLHRVMLAELGAGPLALARAHRAQSARQLLVGTTMPVADVAFAAGFRSIRQFNDTIREVFALTPTQVRESARGRERDHAQGYTPGQVRVTLAHRRPIDAAGVVEWLGQRALPGVETAGPGRYARSLRVGDRYATLTVTAGDDGISAVMRLQDLADLPTVLGRARRLFDLDADPVAIDAALVADPRFAPFVAEVPGIRIPGAGDLGEMLVRAMVGQQVTVASARVQLARLAECLGEPLPAALATDGLSRSFPDMAAVADRAGEVLRGPRARIDAVRAAAGALASGDLVADIAMTRAELTARLIGLKGVGPWTADYVAMRYLGHPDVLVRGDVAIARGARRLGITDAHAEATGVAPWRSYLGLHLWRLAT